MTYPRHFVSERKANREARAQRTHFHLVPDRKRPDREVPVRCKRMDCAPDGYRWSRRNERRTQ